MGRQVSCYITGEKGDSDSFFKAPNGKYYRTEQLYRNLEEEQEYTEKLIVLINTILNNKLNNMSGLIIKELRTSSMSSKELYDCCLKNQQYISDKIGCLNTQYRDVCSHKIHLLFCLLESFFDSNDYAGCYEIHHNVTNSIYIGESLRVFQRMSTHINDLIENKHHCTALQDLYNKGRDISHFTFKPLLIFKSCGENQENIKHDTLYLETAFYIKEKEKRTARLLNTVNPYTALINNETQSDIYKIDCKNVLYRLLDDRFGVLSVSLRKRIKENLDKSNVNINYSFHSKNVSTFLPVDKLKDIYDSNLKDMNDIDNVGKQNEL